MNSAIRVVQFFEISHGKRWVGFILTSTHSGPLIYMTAIFSKRRWWHSIWGWVTRLGIMPVSSVKWITKHCASAGHFEDLLFWLYDDQAVLMYYRDQICFCCRIGVSSSNEETCNPKPSMLFGVIAARRSRLLPVAPPKEPAFPLSIRPRGDDVCSLHILKTSYGENSGV